MIGQKLTVTNLQSGEVINTDLQLAAKQHSKYAINGHKIYTKGMIDVITNFTRSEVIKLLQWHADTNIIGPSNMFKINFRTLTKGMDRIARSKFKRKLKDFDIIVSYGSQNKKMLNPYTFLPRKDKTYEDSQYWCQRVWTYLQNDKDNFTTDVLDYVEVLFDDN